MRRVCLALILIFNLTTPLQAEQTKENPLLIILTLDGKNFDLKEKRGKVVLVNFWAKWCTSCRKEMLVLDEIYQKYKSRNLEIIGINIGKKRERQKVIEASSNLSYPNAMFYEAKETNFEEPDSIPLTYVIDKNGKVVTKIIPSEKTLTTKEFEIVIKPLL